MAEKIAVIDYDAGNLRNVEKAFLSLGQRVIVTDNKEEILSASHVVLPGVGSFGDCMASIRKKGLDCVIKNVIENKTPFLGICLGMQLLFARSEESPGVEGLGILEGEIKKLPDCGLKIPHMGWNDIHCRGRLFEGLTDPFVYFVHSYYLQAKNPAVVSATTVYGIEIQVGVEKDNVFAVQFHPEKSGSDGLKILENFTLVRREDYVR